MVQTRTDVYERSQRSKGVLKVSGKDPCPWNLGMPGCPLALEWLTIQNKPSKGSRRGNTMMEKVKEPTDSLSRGEIGGGRVTGKERRASGKWENPGPCVWDWALNPSCPFLSLSTYFDVPVWRYFLDVINMCKQYTFNKVALSPKWGVSRSQLKALRAKTFPEEEAILSWNCSMKNLP